MTTPVFECACKECVGACKKRPCWGTPQDIKKLMAAGLGGKLMEDYWVRSSHDEGNIMIISPAIRGYEGHGAPFSPFGRCVFLDKNDRCEIHDMKPTEGAEARCCDASHDAQEIHQRMAFSWDTNEGRALVEEWRASL